MDEEKIQERKNYLIYAKSKMQRAYNKYWESKKLTDSLRLKWDEWKEVYEQTDMELAEVDGRLEVLPPTGRVKREKKVEPLTLTMDQIKDLAAKVGIILDLNEECNLE